MQIREGLSGLRSLPPGAVLSVGNYDGIHLGHQKLLALANALRNTGKNARATKKDTSPSPTGGTDIPVCAAPVCVVTFEPHPLTVLRPELAPPRLTPSAIKRALLEAAGVDDYVVLPPAPEVLNLTAEAFWAILRDEVRPTHLIEGPSFNFGKGRGGTIDRLREWAIDSAIKLHVMEGVEVTLCDLTIAPLSSSLIRWLLAHGRVRDAAIGLGRNYALRGEVIQGFQRGRTIGVPTANLRCSDQLIPADGVYAGACTIDGARYPAAVSIGSLPTFEEREFQVEAHLIGFTGDLYGQVIEVELIDWVREQWKFNGIEALKKQIARDLDRVKLRVA